MDPRALSDFGFYCMRSVPLIKSQTHVRPVEPLYSQKRFQAILVLSVDISDASSLIRRAVHTFRHEAVGGQGFDKQKYATADNLTFHLQSLLLPNLETLKSGWVSLAMLIGKLQVCLGTQPVLL